MITHSLFLGEGGEKNGLKKNVFSTCYAGHSTETPVNPEPVIRLEEKNLSSLRSTVYNSDTFTASD